VGANQKPYVVHKSLLCQTSSFFRAAFEGDFREASENVVKLPEEREPVFKKFLHWLYFDYTAARVSEQMDQSEASERSRAAMAELIDLYLLADRLGIPSLTEDVVKEFHECVTNPRFVYPLQICKIIYNLPITAEPLRRMVVALFVWRVDVTQFAADENIQAMLRECSDFAADTLAGMGRRYGKARDNDPLFKGYECFLRDGKNNAADKPSVSSPHDRFFFTQPQQRSQSQAMQIQ
jgi:BTB/POZ domain